MSPCSICPRWSSSRGSCSSRSVNQGNRHADSRPWQRFRERTPAPRIFLPRLTRRAQMHRNRLGFPAFRHARRLYGAVVDGGAIVAPGLSLDRRTQVRRLLPSECSILAFAPMSMSNDDNASTGGDKTWPCARDAGLLGAFMPRLRLSAPCHRLARAELSNALAATAAESRGLGGPT